MIQFDDLVASAPNDPFASMQQNGSDYQREMAEQELKREELRAMVHAVYQTPAGRYVFEWLVDTYMLRGHFKTDITKGCEAVALHGVWSTAQAEVVGTLLSLLKQSKT